MANFVTRAMNAVRGRTDAPVGPVAGTTKTAPSAQYFRRGASQFLAAWRPALRDAREDVQSSYLSAAARTVDAIHNNGFVAGAVDAAVAVTVGVALRLSAVPDRTVLGWDDETAEQWIDEVESRWIQWSENPVECDAGGRYTIGQMTCQVLKSYFSHGEAVALLPYLRRPESRSAVKVQVLPAHKLVQDTNELERLFQGVRVDGYSMPVAYRFNRNDRFPAVQQVEILARDDFGRPQVVHVFDGLPGQTRGITPFATVLRVIAQFDQLQDATLTAALIQAIFAATMESALPTAEVLEGLKEQYEGQARPDVPENSGFVPANGLDAWNDLRASWYEDTKVDLGSFGKIAHTFPGETLKFNRSEHPNSTYEAFGNFLLREAARAAGLTSEQFTGDFTKATYSSVRMSGAFNWPIVLNRRANICGRFCQAGYEAWLEEEIETGRMWFPGGFEAFLANRHSAVQAEWRGPAKPQADDLKAQKAHSGYQAMGVMSDEEICSDLGTDVVDTYKKRAREKRLRAKLGLPDPAPQMGSPAASHASDDDETADERKVAA